MLVVKYDPEKGNTVPDKRMEDFSIESYKKSKTISYMPHTITVGSDTMVTMFQVMIKEGKIPYSDIRFTYCGETLFCNSKGRFIDYGPKSYHSTVEDRLR